MLTEEGTDPGGGPHLQLAQLAVLHGAGLLGPPTGGPPSPPVQQVPAPGAEHGEGLPAARRRGEDDRFDEREPDREGDETQQRPARVAGEHDPNSSAGHVTQRGDVLGTSSGRGLDVRGARVGRDDDARAGEPRPPTQVQVFGAGEGLGVEALEHVEQVGSHQHRGARHVEDVPHRVVLLLVELARLDPGVRAAEPVDVASDVEEHLGILGGHQLRADDRRVRPVRLLDEDTHRVGGEHDVVVAAQEEGGTGHDVQRLVGRATETGVRPQPAVHVGVGEHRGDACGRVDHRSRRRRRAPTAPGSPGRRAPRAPARGRRRGCG